MASRGLYPKVQALELERQIVEVDGQLERAKANLAGADAAIAERRAELERLEYEWESELHDDLNDALDDREQIKERLSAQEAVLADLKLSAPMDGIIQELGTLSEGQSVPANSKLMKLVPTHDRLVVRAEIANQDVSRIKLGMPATIKVRAFDFARFGTIEGTVSQIAADATYNEATDRSSYEITVTAAEVYVGAEKNNTVLPGMAVDVELTVGERSLLSYLTDRITHFSEKTFSEG